MSRLILLFTIIIINGCVGDESPSPWVVHGIVPTIIPTPPPITLNVTFASAKSAQLGNKLKPRDVRQQPEVAWNADPDTFYTLAMIDPDAPSRQMPKMAQWRHWLVGNVHGGDVENGDVLAAYVGAGPPPLTDLHRYVLLVYEQPDQIDFQERHVSNTSLFGRPKFDMGRFAAKYHLGALVAGNFFLAEYDDYVPILHAQFHDD